MFGMIGLQGCDGLIVPEKKNAPWFLLANQSSSGEVTPITPPGKGIGNLLGAGVPTVGAYFYQTDHLGSTAMLTDGEGNQVAGPGQSGVSYISYLPYGETSKKISSGLRFLLQRRWKRFSFFFGRTRGYSGSPAGLKWKL